MKELTEQLRREEERILGGGKPKYHQQLAQQGKLFVRRRLELLFDDGSLAYEDGRRAESLDPELPAEQTNGLASSRSANQAGGLQPPPQPDPSSLGFGHTAPTD